MRDSKQVIYHSHSIQFLLPFLAFVVVHKIDDGSEDHNSDEPDDGRVVHDVVGRHLKKRNILHCSLK